MWETEDRFGEGARKEETMGLRLSNEIGNLNSSIEQDYERMVKIRKQLYDLVEKGSDPVLRDLVVDIREAERSIALKVEKRDKMIQALRENEERVLGIKHD